MSDMIEAVARAMADSLALDWGGKAKGNEYANHGYWLPLAQAAITAHTAALIAGAGELEKRLTDHAHMAQRDGLWSMLDTAGQAAATIAALRAELATARLEGVRLGIEAARREAHKGFIQAQDSEFDTGVNYARDYIAGRIVMLDAEAIAKGEG